MLVLLAPAKINLYLHITGKRADGYHLLDTAFQLIDWCDTVKLQARADGRIVLHTPIAGLDDSQHLSVKAAMLLKAQSESTLGSDIWVDKHIPTGAGLGGGSSDAATTLMGLNHLWGCGLSAAGLQTLGLQLGADVPFFCSQLGTAHASGIGEILEPIPTPDKVYIVVYPNCHVSTPAVFKHTELKWSNKKVQALDTYLLNQSAFAQSLGNDLQAPAVCIAPAIAQAMTWLSMAEYCEGIRMSGSGSAVFAQFANTASAQHALAHLPRSDVQSNWQMRIAKPLAKHPSLDFFTDSV